GTCCGRGSCICYSLVSLIVCFFSCFTPFGFVGSCGFTSCFSHSWARRMKTSLLAHFKRFVWYATKCMKLSMSMSSSKSTVRMYLISDSLGVSYVSPSGNSAFRRLSESKPLKRVHSTIELPVTRTHCESSIDPALRMNENSARQSCVRSVKQCYMDHKFVLMSLYLNCMRHSSHSAHFNPGPVSRFI